MLETNSDRRIVATYLDTDLPDNQIKTAKYTYFSFIPLNLMFQFSKLANAYFLIIGVMQMVNAISITNGQPVIFGPLIIVVSISMLKDFFEDYKRHKSDREENTKQVQKLAQGGFSAATWEALYCGDVVQVQQNEYIPADLIVIGSSDNKGKAFVETKSLDGETNLKEKLVPKGLPPMLMQDLYQSI
jgi:phospholipid-transporting ATPase